MRLFTAKAKPHVKSANQALERKLKTELAKTTLELNAYKQKFLQEKIDIEKEHEKFVENIVKNRSELISEVEELEKQRLVLLESVDAKRLCKSLEDALEKEGTIDSRIDLLNQERVFLEDEKQSYVEAKNSVRNLCESLQEKLESISQFNDSIEEKEKEIRESVGVYKKLVSVLDDRMMGWERAIKDNEQFKLYLINVIGSQMDILDAKRDELDKKQKLIFSQQSALKAYAKDRR